MKWQSSIVKVNIQLNSEYSNVVNTVGKSFIPLVQTLKDKSMKNNYNYNNLLTGTQYIKTCTVSHQKQNVV